MLITSSVSARSNRQTLHLDLGNQEITILKSKFRVEERMMILLDKKCQRADRCYQNNPVEALIRTYRISNVMTATYFYEVKNGQLNWNMVLFQEEQKGGVIDVVIDRISVNHAIAWSGFTPSTCNGQVNLEIPNIDISTIETALHTSIHSIDDLVYSSRDIKQFLTGFDASLYLQEIIQDQVKTSNTNIMAAATTMYAVQGVEDTVYGFTQNDPRLDDALSIISNDTIPSKLKNYSVKKATYEMKSASKRGASLFSSAWFNLRNKQNHCYTLNNKTIQNLLE